MTPEALPLRYRFERPLPIAAAIDRFAALPRAIVLESSTQSPPLGRYTFLMADPVEVLDETPLPLVLQRLTAMATPVGQTGLPPFQGGVAGYLGYEFANLDEPTPLSRCDDFRLPRHRLALYDVVYAYDHRDGSGWLLSQGVPEPQPQARRARAEARLAHFRELLARPPRPSAAAEPRPRSLDDLAEQFPVAGHRGVTSTFSHRNYLAAVQRSIDYIRAGDVFQVNLAQRLLLPATFGALRLYHRLRRCSPAPFSAYLDLGDFQIVSASPERFLSVRGGFAETRPIKGTRPRSGDALADARRADELRESVKDRAENVMIVDLLRNDLARVCRDDSVRVTQLCEVEWYAQVLHLVSAVEGRLAAGIGALDVLRTILPGGSISGAPKQRAREIIAELEPTARGPYCGVAGYVSLDGSADFNILIRTVVAAGGWWQMGVGGGVVAASDPEREYDETLHKAAGLLIAAGAAS